MPNPSAALVGTLGVCCLFYAGGHGAGGQSATAKPCPRKAPLPFDPETVTVVEDATPPCRFVFRPTGIQLRAVSDGSRPDPGWMVLRDSRGRYYSTNARGWRGVIGVWDSSGEYQSSMGGVGEGPGELGANGILSIFVDGADRLHVRDGGFNWSVFSPDHEYLHRVPSRVMVGLQKTTVILDSGMALTSTDGYDDRTRYFRLVDTTGALHRTFGSVDPQVSQSGERLSRTLAYRGGDTFWAGPAVGDPRGYLVEEWGIDGTLHRSLRRDAAWFDPLDDERRVEVGNIHIDDSGLLYIMVARPTEELAEAVERARSLGQRVSRDDRSALMEVFFEVIDSRTGELLASEVHQVSRARTFLPNQFFRGSNEGAVYVEEGDDLLPFVQIVSVELEAR